MKENRIAVFAFVLALAGLLLLYWISQSMKPEQVGIAGLGSKDAGRYVEASGFVKKAEVKDGNVFIELCEGEACVSVVVFEGAAKKMGVDAYSLKAGDFLTARGVVKEYNLGMEIVVSDAGGLSR